MMALLLCLVILLSAQLSGMHGVIARSHNPYGQVKRRIQSDRTRFEEDLSELTQHFRARHIPFVEPPPCLQRMRKTVFDQSFVLPTKQWVVHLDNTNRNSPKVPILRLLLRFHIDNPINEDIRAVLLRLLTLGLNPNTETPMTGQEPPLMFTVLLSPSELRYDAELLNAFIAAGASMEPIMFKAGGDTPTVPPGISVFHAVAFPHQNAVILQSFLQEIFATMRESPVPFEVAAGNTSVRISGTVVDSPQSRWAAQGLLETSPTLRELATKWNDEVPKTSFVGQAMVQAVIQEWAVGAFRAIVKAKLAIAVQNQSSGRHWEVSLHGAARPHSSIEQIRTLVATVTEMAIPLPRAEGGRDLTLFHIAAQKGWGDLLVEVNELVQQLRPAMDRPPPAQSNTVEFTKLVQTAREYLQIALSSQSVGRNPLHLAARWVANYASTKGAVEQVTVAESWIRSFMRAESSNETLASVLADWNSRRRGAPRDALTSLLDVAVTAFSNSPLVLRSLLNMPDRTNRTVLDWLQGDHGFDTQSGQHITSRWNNSVRPRDQVSVDAHTMAAEDVELNSLRDRMHRNAMCDSMRRAILDDPSLETLAGCSLDHTRCSRDCIIAHLKSIAEAADNRKVGSEELSNVDPCANGDTLEIDPRGPVDIGDGFKYQCVPRVAAERCDFVQVEGLPQSPTEMAKLLELDRPIVFRGGLNIVDGFSTLWNSAVFETVHRNVSVRVSRISNRDVGGEGDWESSKSENFETQTLGTFLSSPQCRRKKHIRVRIDQTSNGTRVMKIFTENLPDILSSSDVYSTNPQLLFGLTGITDFLRTVPGVNIPRAGL